MMKFSFILLSLISNFFVMDCARILAAFPSACRSHHQVFRLVVKALLERKHDLVIITTFPEYQESLIPDNLTEIDIQEVTLKAWAEAMVTISEDNSVFNKAKFVGDIVMIISEKQLNTKVVQDLLHDEEQKFDLIITETYLKPFYYLSYKYKAPLILLSSSDHIHGELIGVPVHYILYPQYLRMKLFNLTVWDTVTELYNNIKLRRNSWGLDSWVDAIIKTIDSHAPNIQELYNNIDVMIGNVHRIWNSNRPLPPSAVLLSGTHLKLPANLSQDIQGYLDSSTNGAIFLSFGTSVSESQLPKDKIQLMLKVFSEFSYNVLWKWNANEIPGQPKNVLVRKWFQQADILRHPNVKLIITQGGLQSIDEAIAAGIPLLPMPIFFDQFENAERIEYFGMGRQLNIFTMTEDEFRNTVKTVIDDESYRRNVEYIRDLFHDQPQSPLERLVWWTEYVLRHGGASHLRCPAANMPWTEYFEVELVMGIFIIVFLVVITAFISLRCALRVLLRILNGDKFKMH